MIRNRLRELYRGEKRRIVNPVEPPGPSLECEIVFRFRKMVKKIQKRIKQANCLVDKIDYVVKSGKQVGEITKRKKKDDSLCSGVRKLRKLLSEEMQAVSDGIGEIKRLVEENRKENDGGLDSIGRVYFNQQQTVQKEYLRVIQRKSKTLSHFQSVLRKEMKRQLRVVTGEKVIDDEVVNELIRTEKEPENLKKEKLQLYPNKRVLRETLHVEIQIDMELQEELIEFTDEMNELMEMFRDMESLVQEQGVLVDNIGLHVEKTLEYMKASIKNIQKARVERGKPGKFAKWMMVYGLDTVKEYVISFFWSTTMDCNT